MISLSTTTITSFLEGTEMSFYSLENNAGKVVAPQVCMNTENSAILGDLHLLSILLEQQGQTICLTELSFASKYRLGGGHRSCNVARSPRTALGEALNGSTSYEQPSLVKKFAHLFQVLTVKAHCSSGQTGGPHIDFLASPKCGKQVILQD
ncbi:hypothetical protein CDAR_212271 [Caerostris darwini]|uniref:Uncharacterized protein n=1 Tax=Caerostris darwini TaxID=1538125 RepID=A0AAV4RC65_9ARAC|nr:hypothetical protein CDAR_212271 [Caerostris darwini]